MGVALVLLAAPRLERAGYGASWLIAVLGVIALYLSVLAHELAHVAEARRHAQPVRSVTLHMVGGETLMEGDARTPGQELTTSASGPLASAALGGVLVLVGELAGDGDVATVVTGLGWINLVVAGVNLLPALPLDGGRMLRAVVWALTDDELRGVIVAGWIGRLAGLAVGAFGLTRLIEGGRTGWFDFALCAVLGLFLWQGSGQALRSANRASRIRGLQVRRLADSTRPDPEWPRLSADLEGAELLRSMTLHPSEEYAVVDETTGEILGTLRTRTVNRAYRVGARR